MAVGVLIEVANFSEAQYDLAAQDVMPGGRLPNGCLSHMSGPTENGGWRVADMWESQEAFERFAQNSLGAAMAKAGATAQPEIKFWPIHATQHTH